MEFKSIELYDINNKKKFKYTFNHGLNIVYGGNGSGKSTVIKSLMYTLGFPIVNWSDDIINEIDSYIYCINFNLKKNEHTLIRYGDTFLFDGERLEYKEISSSILNELKGNVPEIKMKNGEYIEPYLEDVIQFYYVDQDNSWGKETYRDVHANWAKVTKPDYCIFFERILGFDYNEIIEINKRKETIKQSMNRNTTVIDNTNEIIESLYGSVGTAPINKEEIEANIEASLQYGIESRRNLERLNKKILDNLDKLHKIQANINFKEKIYKQKKNYTCKTCGQLMEQEKISDSEFEKGALLNSIIQLKQQYNEMAKQTRKLQEDAKSYDNNISKIDSVPKMKEGIESYKKYIIKSELMSQVSMLYLENGKLNSDYNKLNYEVTKRKTTLRKFQKQMIIRINSNIKEVDEHFEVKNNPVKNLNPIIPLSDTGVERIKKGIAKYLAVFSMLDEFSELEFPYIMDTLKKDDFDKINTKKIDVLYEKYLMKLKGQKIVSYAEKLEDIPESLKEYNLIEIKQLENMEDTDFEFTRSILEKFAYINEK